MEPVPKDAWGGLQTGGPRGRHGVLCPSRGCLLQADTRKCLLEGEAATLCVKGLGSRPALLSTLTPLSLSKQE